MSHSARRALWALSLLAIALPGISNAADIGSGPPSPSSTAVEQPIELAPGDNSKVYREAGDEVAVRPTGGFVRKNKLACVLPSPDFGPGVILFENMGPGTLTLGMTIKVVIQPTGKIISYILPYDMPPKSGVYWFNAFPAGTPNVTCTFTATPHPGPRQGKPNPYPVP